MGIWYAPKDKLPKHGDKIAVIYLGNLIIGKVQNSRSFNYGFDKCLCPTFKGLDLLVIPHYGRGIRRDSNHQISHVTKWCYQEDVINQAKEM